MFAIHESLDLNVISKARRKACEVSGHQLSDHFADVGKTISMPKGAMAGDYH